MEKCNVTLVFQKTAEVQQKSPSTSRFSSIQVFIAAMTWMTKNKTHHQQARSIVGVTSKEYLVICEAQVHLPSSPVRAPPAGQWVPTPRKKMARSQPKSGAIRSSFGGTGTTTARYR